MEPSKPKPSHTKQFGFFAALPNAFFSRALCRDVAENWRGYGIRYLAALLFLHLTLSYIPYTVFYNSAALIEHTTKEENTLSSRLYDSAALLAHAFHQFPELNVKNGKAEVKETTPYIIKNKGSETPLLLIDTSGATTSLKNSEAIILITQDAVIAREKTGDKVYYNFAEMPDMTITRESLFNWLRFLPIVVFPGDFLSMLVYFITISLMLGLVGGIFCQIHKIEALRYRDLVRLAAVAATPGLLISGIANALNINLFSHPQLVYFLMHTAYMYHAVESNKPIAKS